MSTKKTIDFYARRWNRVSRELPDLRPGCELKCYRPAAHATVMHVEDEAIILLVCQECFTRLSERYQEVHAEISAEAQRVFDKYFANYEEEPK